MKPLSRLVILGAVLLAAWVVAAPHLGAQSARTEKGTETRTEAKKEATPEKPATTEQLAFFEKSIRPVLVRECYSCHATTAEKVRGGLKLDSRDGLRKGGDT